MARRVAPRRSTSGAGFTFEENVASYILSFLLNGWPPVDADLGSVVRVDFQVRPLGWFLDDLLLTFGGEHRLDLSIKSNLQITTSGFPSEFVGDAWELYLGAGSDAYRRSTDYLGLATIPLDPRVRLDIDQLIDAACHQEPSRFLTELQSSGAASAQKRAIFASLRCPASLAETYGASERDAVHLLSRLRVLTYDFQSLPSRDEAAAMRQCQEALRSGGVTTAQQLWQDLKVVAREHREAGGYLNLARLLSALRHTYDLKPWPDFASDVAAIRSWTDARLAAITDRIGLRVALERADDVKTLQRKFAGATSIALTGVSGCGKSVVAKRWASTLPPGTPVLWVNAEELAGSTLATLENAIALRHPLSELTASLTSREAYCVVDAGERLVVDGFSTLGALVRALSLGDEGSPWRLLLVCQQESWGRILRETSRAVGRDLQFSPFAIVGLAETEFDSVLEAFPQLRPLSHQLHLRPLLQRPKILDLLATRIALGDSVDTATWVGESSAAQWFWETMVARPRDAIKRAKAMLTVAEMQADRLTTLVPAASLPDGADALAADRLLVERNGAYAFEHDLYGDWARLQILVGQVGNLASFVESKLTSPTWNRAVRLYGVYLLEQDPTGARWKTALDTFAALSPAGGLGQDLILESVVFAADPLPLLESLWTYLIADGGALLRKLLGRFLYSATLPNPVSLSLAATPVQEYRQATVDRLPYAPYWMPVLRFLDRHRDEVIAAAPSQIADVAYAWLRETPASWPCRAEAAGLAVGLAEGILLQEETYRYHQQDHYSRAFAAALAAIRELPEQVRSIAQLASGRTALQQPPEVEDDAHVIIRRAISLPHRRRMPLKPWPDGPVRRPIESFERACFETTALFPVIDVAPEHAREVLLALLISPPKERDALYDPTSMLPGEECEVEDFRGHYPPFYWYFPWLYFLRCQAQPAIDAIVSLVNFATARRAEALASGGGPVPGFSFQIGREERFWKGDAQVYTWYTGIWGPNAVCSVLMTLEFWLYEQMAAGESVDDYVAQIAASSQSVAFAGLLAAIARKERTLLKGPLQFLMDSPEVLLTERQMVVHVQPSTQMIAWTGQSEAGRKLAEEWHTLPHRQRHLDEVVRELFLLDPEVRALFEGVRERWGVRRQTAERSGDREQADNLARLMSAFTPEHYSFAYSEEHRGVLVTHEFPQELADRSNRELERANAGLLRTSFPIKCRRLLDREIALTSAEEIRALWQEAQNILSSWDGPEDSPVCKEDIACGVAAVLLVMQPKWLEGQADVGLWCREHIIDTIENPPKPAWFDSDVDASRWCWHSFCAEAIPHLWAQRPADRQLRRCVMLTALDAHYQTVSLLFQACHRVRHSLGEHVIKLEAFLRYWAMERLDLNHRLDLAFGQGFILRASERPSVRSILILPARERNKLLSREFRGRMNAFVKDRLPAILPPLYPPTPPPLRRERDPNRAEWERPRARYGIDIELVRFAYSYLPPLHAAEHPGERAGWLSICQELLECLLWTLRPVESSDAEKEVDGRLYPCDRWILNAMGVLVNQMEDREDPAEIWRPILDLGWTGHLWVEEFISSFISYGLGRAHEAYARQRFVARWTAMLEFASAAPTWNRTSTARRWHLDDVWQHLLGLDELASIYWKEEHADLLLAIGSTYKSAVEAHLGEGRLLYWLIRFLRQPVARLIRVDALHWLEPHLPPYAEWDRYDNTAEQLALLLAECWQCQREALRANAANFECFKRIVKLLADRQEPVALEVQTRVISG